MSVAIGTSQYQMGISPVTGCGFSYSEEELETGLSNYITAIVFDDLGKMRFKAMFTEIATTEFQNGEIEQFLPDSKMDEDWRVGEAIAETYLSHHRGCFFPGRIDVMNVREAPAYLVPIW